jgi:type II secretory pathway component PulJ
MTLIELLLAVTMFAAIAATAGLVLRTAFTSLDKIDAKVDFNRRVITSQRTLDQLLRGMIPVVGPCAGTKVGLRGLPTGMAFVSSFSLSEGGRGRPRMVQLFAAESPNGGLRLLMNELPYWGRQSLALGCGTLGSVSPNSFILADRLASCVFQYKRRDPALHVESWLSTWQIPEWPLGVRIVMTPLDTKSTQVQPGTVYVPVAVMNYNLDDVL